MWTALSIPASVFLGVGVQLWQTELAAASIYVGWVVLGTCLLATAMACRNRRPHWYGLTLCLALGVMAFGQTGWRAARWQALAWPAALEGVSLLAEGTVLSMPQQVTQGQRFRFALEHLQTLDGQSITSFPKGQAVLLGWYAVDEALASTNLSLRAGERWRFVVRLKAPHGHLNPHGFDFELWLWEQGDVAAGYVRVNAREPPPQRLTETSGWRVEAFRQSVREAIAQQVSDRASAGVLAALTVGDQASIERGDWDVFRATGVAHLMAISGLHLTGLAWLARVLATWAWRICPCTLRGRAPALWWPAPQVGWVVGCVVAVLYAVVTGWAVPAQRTVGMLAVVTALRLRGARWPWPLTWWTVAAAVAVCDPWALCQAGFWLSFVAVGLLCLGGASPAGGSGKGWQRHLRQLVHEQLLMSFCLAPLGVLLFQQLSLVGLLANLVCVPWVTLVVTPLCLLGLVLPFAWTLAASALQIMGPILHGLATWPGAQLHLPAVPGWVGLAALAGGICLALPWSMGWRLVGLCWMLPMLFWQVPRPAWGHFEVLAADMGQGHAVLLRTAHHALLYDTGPRYSPETDAGQRVLVPLLQALDIRLDTVVLSHRDSDHSGGLAAVMAMQPQAQVLTSVHASDPMLAGLRASACVRGQRWTWDGVQFEILHPSSSDEARHSKPNALSCVLRVADRSGVRALLVGDIEAAQEQSLLHQDIDVRADWLLVPHHGSNTSSTTAFVQAVHPQWAVVQAGYRNRFGHPRPDVLARYAALGVPVVQNVRCGAARWDSRTPAALHCERDERPRYWHHRVP